MSNGRPDFDDRNFVIEASWFYSGNGAPKHNVAIEVTDGVISDIRPQKNAVESRYVVIPPIVNAHTHLELSDCAQPLPAGATFPEWIGKVIAHRAGRDEPGQAVAQGVVEIANSGTVTVADTVPMDQALDAETSFGRLAFIEYIGLTDDRVNAAVEHATVTFQRSVVGLGISPHAPYSVRSDMLEQLVRIARQADVPMMMHLAETKEELQLLTDGTGPFADMLRAFGIWQAGLFPRLTLCDYIDQLTQAPRAVFAHGNYFEEDEFQLLATRPNATVVFCPRTHRHFGHSSYPLQAMLDRGINMALGTDSRASNPDLSVWNDAAALLEENAEVPVGSVLGMLTQNGSKAVSGNDATIEIGARATFSLLQSDRSLTDFGTLFRDCRPVVGCDDGIWLR